MASTSTSLKRYGKKLVGYPEHHVATVSSRDWLTNLVPSPKNQVSLSGPVSRTVPHGPCAGRRICHESVSYFRLDRPLQ
jgi:hypothetical protein